MPPDFRTIVTHPDGRVEFLFTSLRWDGTVTIGAPKMAEKETSDDVSALAARYINATHEDIAVRFFQHNDDLIADIRRLAASCLSQDETPGERLTRPEKTGAEHDATGEEPDVIKAGVRDGEDEWHIECRFSDGQKYAAVTVDRPFENLAHRIADFLNTPKP